MSEASTLNRHSDAPMRSLPIAREASPGATTTPPARRGVQILLDMLRRPTVSEADRGSGAVRRVNPLNHPGWDARLAAHPECSFFHSAAWASVLAETYRCSPVYFTVFSGDCLVALLPVMEMNSWLTGRRGVALPFSDECEPLGDGSRLKGTLIPEVLQYGRGRDWKYFECRGGKALFNQAPPFQTFFIHELKLFKDERYLFARVESATRRAIRKAEKSGVTIEISQTPEAVQRYYALHCQTRKKHGLPPQPFAFFQNIQKHVLARKKGMVVSARYGQNVIAGAIYFHFGDTALYKFGASDEAFQDFRGNNLVMWEAIKWYAHRGAKVLHLGRTSLTNEGLRRFKLGWGSEERRLEYVRHDLRKNRFMAGKDESVGWYNRPFNLLPVCVLRMIGAVLYRHIA
jgi:hypothetical protein